MKPQLLRSLPILARGPVLALALGLAGWAHGQSFDAGSNGSLGDVVLTANTNIALPPDGKLHFASLTVNSGVTVTFTRNTNNTPVFILSQGDVVINGSLNVDGATRTANTGGLGGPGGFDGGKPGFGAEVPPGSGYGPGGSHGGNGNCSVTADTALGGSYASRQGGDSGPTYGNTLLIPLIGGSGGGGVANNVFGGGGGGGGAILVASSTRVAVNGSILARGGGAGGCINGGSGGAIRLVSFKVEGGGSLNATGSSSGRVRIDTVIRTGISFSIQGVSSVGGNLLVFPPVEPTLSLTEAAGFAIADGSGPVVFTLPFGATTNQTIKIRAANFNRTVPIRVTLTPDSGSPRVFDAEIDNTTGTPATVEVPVTVPVNTVVTVHCWTR